jgi:nicotinamide riboside kinase
MIVVNLLGEPCCGKSTAALYITSKLKENNINAEYISEFAKEKVYENNSDALACQEYLLGEQSYKLYKLRNQIDVAVTDSPLILNAIYNSLHYGNAHIIRKPYDDVVLSIFNRYDNINFLLEREFDYIQNGRIEDSKEAQKVKKTLISFLTNNNILYIKHNSTENSYDLIVKEIMNYLNIKKEENK